MSKVKNQLIGNPIAEKIQLAENIHTKMTGNANYTTPNPTLADIQTVTEELSELNDEAMDGATSKKEERDAKELEFDSKFALLADYVQFASGGNKTKILSSGFEVAAEGTKAGELPPPQNFRIRYVKNESEGKLRLLWDPVDNAGSYVIEKSSDPNNESSWAYVTTTTSSRHTLSGLKSGNKDWYRIRAVGAAGVSSPSDAASKIVP